MGKTLFKNVKAIVSCDAADKVYYDADLLADGSAIITIGKNIDAPDAELVDGRDKYMYPGLINTHHHFFQAFVRNLITIDRPNMTVMQWLETVQPIFKMVDADCIYHASLAAMADLIKHGCTTAFDHQYLYTPDTGYTPIDRQMEAASMLGMRFVAGRGGSTLTQKEGSYIPTEMLETTRDFLLDCERLINTYHDPAPYSMRQIVVAPTQPVSCKTETLIEAATLARAKGVRLHTHLCEGEVSTIAARTGMRSIAFCEKIGFLGPDLWIAHGRETQPFEYPVLAEYGVGISHCTAATFYGATEMLDIPALTKAGVVVSLGCDGCSTNEGSSMLDALRLAYLMQTFRNGDRTGCPLPYDILKLATVNGAAALGRSDIGSLEPGKAADLFMVDLGGLEFAGALHDPRNLLPKLGVTGDVWLTMINGRIVYFNREFPGVDERRLAREGEEVCTRVLRRHCDVFKNLPN